MRTGVNGDTGRDARRMCTRRASLGRLLDPDNDAVTLSTLQKAARAVGRALRLELV
jgi:antitoxin HicB